MKKLLIGLVALISLNAFATIEEENTSYKQLLTINKELRSQIKSDRSFRKLFKKSIRHEEAREELVQELNDYVEKRGLSANVEVSVVRNWGALFYGNSVKDLEFDSYGSFGPNLGISKGVEVQVCVEGSGQGQFNGKSARGLGLYVIPGVGIWTGIYATRGNNGFGGMCLRLGVGFGLQVGVVYEDQGNGDHVFPF